MSEIRFITSSDEHLSNQTPKFRVDDYCASILEKLEWQGDFSRKCKASAVLRGGDFFHVKRADRTSMSTLVHAISIHRKYPCQTYSIVGNHDISDSDSSTVGKQPIGVMFESGTFQRMTDEVFESGTLSVRVVGVDYSPDMNCAKLAEAVRSKGHNYTVAVVHALAEMNPSQRIQSFFNEEILDYRDLVFPGCPDVYVFGHYHKDQSIQEHMGVKFVNLGSIARGALTVDNLDRKPKISMLTFNSAGISAEEIVVPHKDSSCVFDLEKKHVEESSKENMEIFLNKLKSNAAMIGGHNLRQRMTSFMDSPEFSSDEKAAVRELFEAAESGQDKL